MSPTAVTLAHHKIQRGPETVVIDGVLLTPGATHSPSSGPPIWLDESSSKIHVGSSVYTLPSALTLIRAVTRTLTNGATAVALPSGDVSIYDITISAGAPAVTVSGTALSLDGHDNLIFDGTAAALPTANAISTSGTTNSAGAPAVTISEEILWLNYGGIFNLRWKLVPRNHAG